MTDQKLKAPPGSTPPLDPDMQTSKAKPKASATPAADFKNAEEPYLLIPRGFDVNVVSKPTAEKSIKRFVSDGCLTPVLGSEMTDAQTVPGQKIFRDRLLEGRVARELWAFYMSLIAERKLDRGELEDPRRGDEKLPEADNAIADLRLALLEAAYNATALYASAWSDSVQPVYEWTKHTVSLGPELEELHMALVSSLQGATNAIGMFIEKQTDGQESIDHRKDLLGAKGLKTRLENLHDVVEQGGSLRGSTVEWLTDVLWHVTIFDSPCYPTRDELALQVSLAVDSPNPIEKVELTALAPLGLEMDWSPYRYAMSRTLATLRSKATLTDDGEVAVAPKDDGEEAVAPKDDGPAIPEVGKLHRALAQSLNQSYCRWRQICGKSAKDKTPAPAPLAIMLTTDLELERALATEREKGRYHVAFPMVVTSANHHNRGHLRWVVGTFESGIGKNAPDLWQRLVRPVGGWQLFNDVAELFILAGYGVGTKGGLEGPLVLKANGSPLHEVEPNLADNPAIRDGFLQEIPGSNPTRMSGRRGGKVRHVPATTELDILQLTQVDQWAMGSRNGRAGLPEHILNVLNEPTRNWLLLGHDLSEWSSRLQLFTQISLSSLVQPSQSGDSQVRERTLAVVRRADEQRTRLLAGMDIPLTDYDRLNPDAVAAAIRSALPQPPTR